MTQCYSWPEQPNLQHCLSRLLWQQAHIPHNTEQQQLQVFHIDSCSVMSAVCSCPLPAPLLSLLVSDQCYWKSGGMTTNWAGQPPPVLPPEPTAPHLPCSWATDHTHHLHLLFHYFHESSLQYPSYTLSLLYICKPSQPHLFNFVSKLLNLRSCYWQCAQGGLSLSKLRPAT